MNADDFRHLYDYHFTANRRLWDYVIVPMDNQLFAHPISYSVGSIRNQCVHVASVDDRWFSGLAGTSLPDFANPIDYPDKASVRAYWDVVEQRQRAVLTTLDDAQLETHFPGFFSDFKVWQILFHVLNHGTDHRSQIHAMLHTLGVTTKPQDYIFIAHGWDVYQE
ncbi:MAG: DinB family protein [Anaerolineae bacterium]|jgi:uncharacterized damage-inducible protein DinB|nr:DinB family protein [Anaerolineae bacterium]